ncbi:MAG: OmpH family outer membrane protein [Bacteroidales bacterium]|nr:OmpH family outer membrane protein [Bacteroidales bacterium]MBR2607258.1 OmpH family outer membrane protein [Bacteroidaceae bacterium]
MKKFLVLLLIVAPMSLFAQKFGYINSVEIVQVMPEYIKAQNDYQTLQKQYADEYERLRKEFEKKGAEYEQAKDSLPAAILQRREKELQEQYTRLQQYEQESYQNLQQAQQKSLGEVNQVLNKAIQTVGQDGGYVCVFDVASGIPYISKTLCDDLTEAVKTKLGIKKGAKPAAAAASDKK